MTEHKTYGEYQFVIEGGFYTIAELEKLVEDLKTAQVTMSDHLTKSMQEAAKWNNTALRTYDGKVGKK